MAHIDSGVSAAKRATWRDTDHRPLLRKILAENPRATETELRKLFLAAVLDDDDYTRSCVDYCFDLGVRAWGVPDEQTVEQRREKKAKRASAIRHAVEKNKSVFKARVEHEVKTAFLTMVMPNGKLLAKCTGAELVEFGDWSTRLGQRIPADQIVENVLSEKQVAKIIMQVTSKTA